MLQCAKILEHKINILSIFYILFTLSEGHKLDVHYMTPGVILPRISSGDKIAIYCYNGVSKHLFHVWQTVYVSINLQPNEYTLYQGSTPQSVLQMYEGDRSSWIGQLFNWRKASIRLNPFNKSCIGIYTSKYYEVSLFVIRTDFWKIIVFILGLWLYTSAQRLSSNSFFYYICGILLGITTSILIIFYFISKLIPRKPAFYGFWVGGCAVGTYLFQILWENIKIIALNYQREVALYMFVTGFISFIVCYRFGPVTDSRTKNLINWTLKIMSLILIFYSSECQEFSVTCILLLLFYYNFPHSWSAALLMFWKKRFPPRVRLLSEDEYHEQGVRETMKALDELRKYCSSPECKQWKTILTLREPIRFAHFVEGKSHLSDTEILEYESEARKIETLLTDTSEDDQSEYS